MTSKQVVDDHFSKHYKYYMDLASYRYKGRYLDGDLCHETYLAVLKKKPETIERLNKEGKLRTVFISCMRELFRSRETKANRISNGQVNNSSPLLESNELEIDFEMQEDECIDELQLSKQYAKALEAINKALQEPSSNRVNWLKVKTFLAIQESTINAVSIKTKISRPFITEVYNEGREYLKQEILK